LKYQGESGALNEHVADVFGMLITLWAEKKTTAESDWLIGEGCLMPGTKGVALRNMKYPGTAYDDPQVSDQDILLTHIALNSLAQYFVLSVEAD
jgi:Zn-dependent metalloprotease